MKKLLLSIFSLIIVTLCIEAQNSTSSSKFDKNKLSVGGNFGLQFGDYTVINISPQVGYDLSKYFTVGTGFGYTYYKDKGYSNNYRVDYKSSYLSYNIFGRIYPIREIVLSLQPEISRMWQTIDYGRESVSETKFVPSLLIGGGFSYGGMIAMIQYDLIQDINTPYGNSIFYTVGYCFRF